MQLYVSGDTIYAFDPQIWDVLMVFPCIIKTSFRTYPMAQRQDHSNSSADALELP